MNPTVMQPTAQLRATLEMQWEKGWRHGPVALLLQSLDTNTGRYDETRVILRQGQDALHENYASACLLPPGINTNLMYRMYPSHRRYGFRHIGKFNVPGEGGAFARGSNQRTLEGAWARHAKELDELAPHVKNYVEALNTGGYRAIITACSELVTRMEGTVGYAVTRAHLSGLCETLRDKCTDLGEDTYPVLASCGHFEVNDDVRGDDRGSTYCDSCAEELVEVDGDLYHRDRVYYWESDQEYHLEEEEEEEEEEEDAAGLESWGANTTHSLDHDRSFTSSTLGDFIMGVEVEVESKGRYGDSLRDVVDETRDEFNSEGNLVVLKADGSLSDQGFEIVTAARRLPDLIKMFDDWTPHRSLVAWNPGTCGTHVHIDSRAFTALTLGKFLMFINDRANAPFIKAIAGRHPTIDGGNAERYCAAQDQTQLDLPSKALRGYGHSSRYRMVNLCNLTTNERARLTAEGSRDSKGSYSTVELRIFRASLKKERLLAQIEFTHAAVMFCRVTEWHKLNGDAFKAWLGTVAGQYKNLARWYGVNIPKTDKRPGKAAAPQRQLDETVA